MRPLPKRLFVAAGDTGGSNDLYLYSTTVDKIEWRQVFYFAGGAPGCAVDDFSAKCFSFNNIIILLTFDAAVPDNNFISFDRGSSWANFVLGTIPYCYGGNDESAMYLCTINRLYVSTNKGTIWNLKSTFRTMPYTGVPLLVFRLEGAALPVFLIFNDEGLLYRSANDGFTWASINTGLVGVQKVIRSEDTLIAFGSTQSCKSTDQGVTWSAPVDYFAGIVPGVDFFRDADQSDFEASTIVATVEGKICISRDFATSWLSPIQAYGGILHSIVHAYVHYLISVSRNGGLYLIHRSLAETTDQIAFDVGNVDIHPGSIFKVSEQDTDAYTSIITPEVICASHVSDSFTVKSRIEQ